MAPKYRLTKVDVRLHETGYEDETRTIDREYVAVAGRGTPPRPPTTPLDTGDPSLRDEEVGVEHATPGVHRDDPSAAQGEHAPG